jgi:hypothetical protein
VFHEAVTAARFHDLPPPAVDTQTNLLPAMNAGDRPRARSFAKLGLIGINSLIRRTLYLELGGRQTMSMVGQSVRANLMVKASIRSVNRGRRADHPVLLWGSAALR